MTACLDAQCEVENAYVNWAGLVIIKKNCVGIVFQLSPWQYVSTRLPLPTNITVTVAGLSLRRSHLEILKIEQA